MNQKKFTSIISIFLLIIVISITGYSMLLGVGFIDALYMTAITISTVGYGEVAPMTDAAKLFTVVVIMAGLGTVGYGFTSLVRLFFEGEFKEAWRKRKMINRISTLQQHYIICGAGEIGQTVIEQLQKKKVSFVVIERNEERAQELVEEGILIIKDDATSEDALQKAKIMEAKGIVCTLANDADNVYTVLTARQINPDIYIIAKSIEKGAHVKLLRAGANNTISANEIGGRRIAAMVLRPTIKSFLDVMTQIDDVSLDMEEVMLCAGSHMAGRTLQDIKIPEKTGLIVLAIRKKGSGKLLFNPSSDTMLEQGDSMMVLGQATQVDELRGFACEILES